MCSSRLSEVLSTASPRCSIYQQIGVGHGHGVVRLHRVRVPHAAIDVLDQLSVFVQGGPLVSTPRSITSMFPVQDVHTDISRCPWFFEFVVCRFRHPLSPSNACPGLLCHLPRSCRQFASPVRNWSGQMGRYRRMSSAALRPSKSLRDAQLPREGHRR